MSKLNYVTEAGLNRLREDLDRLKNVERVNASKAIAEARDKGDLSENAEYDAAKEAQGMLELRISKMEHLIQNSRVIDESKIDFSKVQIMTKIKIKNLKTGQEIEYSIVSESEADLKQKKIAVSTPIASGLLGKKVGEIAKVKVPAGEMEFEVLAISPMEIA